MNNVPNCLEKIMANDSFDKLSFRTYFNNPFYYKLLENKNKVLIKLFPLFNLYLTHLFSCIKDRYAYILLLLYITGPKCLSMICCRLKREFLLIVNPFSRRRANAGKIRF